MSKKDTLDALRVHHEDGRKRHADRISRAVREAFQDGFTVTIVTAPKQPPAMGSYDLDLSVRLGRQQYQAEMALEREIKDEQP